MRVPAGMPQGPVSARRPGVSVGRVLRIAGLSRARERRAEASSTRFCLFVGVHVAAPPVRPGRRCALPGVPQGVAGTVRVGTAVPFV